MTRAELLDELRPLVEERKWTEIRDRVADWPAAELAELLVQARPLDRILLFRAFPRELAGEVFAELGREARDQLLADLTDEETKAIIREMEPDDRTQMLEELPGEVVQRLLNFLSGEELKEARTLLGYPEDSVGRLMTPDYVMVRPDWTVGRALEHIRDREGDYETVNVVYVVGKDGVLRDAIGLRRLIMAQEEDLVETLVRGPLITMQANDDQEDAVRAMQRYDLAVLPVVNDRQMLLGIVTADDVLDVVEEEVTEDFHKMAPVGLMKSSVLEAGVYMLWRARVGWLLVLVFMNVFSGAGIEYFEDTLAATIALAFFLPLLIDSGGNAGSQAATLMVRALATGEVKLRNWLQLVGKEIFVSTFLGMTMAAGVMAIASFRAPEVIPVVGITMVLVVTVGSLIGTALPFLLTRLKLDPATASAPLITSLADIAGVLIYFSVARAILGV
ncbi:MAG: magnesium transporter [Gemmatimonadales bacterium]|nr:MAG: magnesium transporter [Gemmatimonadales bacterium]